MIASHRSPRFLSFFVTSIRFALVQFIMSNPDHTPNRYIAVSLRFNVIDRWLNGGQETNVASGQLKQTIGSLVDQTLGTNLRAAGEAQEQGGHAEISQSKRSVIARPLASGSQLMSICLARRGC